MKGGLLVFGRAERHPALLTAPCVNLFEGVVPRDRTVRVEASRAAGRESVKPWDLTRKVSVVVSTLSVRIEWVR